MLSLAYIVIAALFFFPLWKLSQAILQRLRDPLPSIPGPWYTRWTDLVLKYHWLRGRRAIYVHHLHKTCGPTVRISPTQVDFTDLSAVKTIHSTTRPFMKDEWYANLSSTGLQNVFNTRDYKFHARHRRLLSSPLSESQLKTFEGLVRAQVELAVEKMGEEMKKRGAADVFKWWFFMTTDIIGELSFGESFRMLEHGQKNQYALDLERVGFFSTLRTTFPSLIQLSAYVPIPFTRAAAVSAQRLRAYGEESIKRYRNMIAAEPENPKPTLFTKLFRAGDEGLSHTEIQAEASAYIVAGTDTTAISLTYLTWAVCRNDLVKRALVDELSNLPVDYKDQDLKGLPYLNQVIRETLRLFSAVPSGLPREVPQGGVELAGYWMPGGLTATTQAYSLHRDPVIFPQPERFDPSRWANPTKEMRDSWMPFGAGARTCLGLHLAEMELRVGTARFFRAFPNAKMSTLEGMGEADMEQTVYFLMHPKGKRCLIQAS